MRDRAGRGRVEIVRTADEQYRLAGTFRIGETEREVGLESAQVQVGQNLWNLTHPATLLWDDRSVRVDSLTVRRAGEDPMRLVARGTLARGGSSDFRIDLEGLHLERLVHIGQFEGIDIGGHVDLGLTVSGPAESPRIDGLFRVDGPRYDFGPLKEWLAWRDEKNHG